MHSPQGLVSQPVCLGHFHLNANGQFSTIHKPNLGVCVAQANQPDDQHSLNGVEECRKSDCLQLNLTFYCSVYRGFFVCFFCHFGFLFNGILSVSKELTEVIYFRMCWVKLVKIFSLCCLLVQKANGKFYL